MKKTITFLLLIISIASFGQQPEEVRLKNAGQSYTRVSKMKYVYEYFNDFINTVSTTTTGNDVVAINSTGSSAAQATNAANRVGIIRSTTAASATGRTFVVSGVSALALGGGEVVYETALNVTTLSNGTERFQLLVGLIDVTNNVNQSDGVYFLYDEGGVSTSSTAAAYWQTVTVSNSSRTFNTSLTQTTVSAATWVNLKIIVNAAGTSAAFYINDTLVATHTANIPTGASRATGFGWGLVKSIGTTARTVDVDKLMLQIIYTTPL